MKNQLIILSFTLAANIYSAPLDTSLCNKCNPCNDSIVQSLKYETPMAITVEEWEYIRIRKMQCYKYQKENPVKEIENKSVSNKSSPNEIKEEPYKPFLDIGLGFGIDYGGFVGLKVSYVPLSRLSIFASLGNYFPDIGWNTGVTFYIIEKTNKNIFRPFLCFAYGLNSYLHITYGYSPGNTYGHYDAYYSCFSLGAGTEIRFGKTRENGLNISLGFIFPSKRLQDDYRLTTSSYVTYKDQSNLFAFSLGYHFDI